MLLLIAGGEARLAARDGGAREEVRCGQRAEETKPSAPARGLGQTDCRRAGWLQDGWICGSGGER